MAIFTAIATGAAALATFIASTVTVSSFLTPTLGSRGEFVASDVAGDAA